jgi:hypothetical protein
MAAGVADHIWTCDEIAAPWAPVLTEANPRTIGG